jgi:hypothetical protein
MSVAKPKTSNVQATTENVQNLNLQDTSGLTLGNSDGNFLVTTDQGAVQAGVDLGLGSFDLSRALASLGLNTGADLASSGLGVATDISHDALTLGRNALDTVESVSTAGLDHAQAAYGSALTFGGDALAAVKGLALESNDRVARFATDALATNYDTSTNALDAVVDAGSHVLDFAAGLFTNALDANQRTVDTNLKGVNALAAQVSQSATQSVNQGVQKVALYAFIAVAAIFIAPALLKGAKPI